MNIEQGMTNMKVIELFNFIIQYSLFDLRHSKDFNLRT